MNTPVLRLRASGCLALIVLLTGPVWAQNTQPGSAPLTQAAAPSAHAIESIWPDGKMPVHGAKDPEGERPPAGDNVRRLINVSRPTLEVFLAPKPTPGASPAPAVIVLPGGGYQKLSYDKEGTEVAAWLNAQGFTALVLKYRVPDNRPGAFQDIQRSLRLARSRAGEWNIDPTRLGVLGFSAGGHLAARASTAFEQSSYAALDDIDRQADRPDFAILVYPAFLDTSAGSLAPEIPLSGRIPPTLIIHSLDDKSFIASSRVYDAALTAAGIPHDYEVYATGGHGYGLRSAKAARAWPARALLWLREKNILK